MISVNNKIICKPYEGKRKVEANIKSGFATVKQKTTIVGLEVLSDAQTASQLILRGSKIYVSEEYLYTQATKVMESDCIKEPFIIIDWNHVLMVTTV